MSKSYCALPFTHLYITTDGSVQPCCRFRYHTPEGEPTEWNTVDRIKISEFDNLVDILQQNPNHHIVQQKMLSGKTVKGCSACHIEERNTGTSMRIEENKQWGSNYDKSNTCIKSIEITFGNYCNLACRICGSALSTSWIKDEEKLDNAYSFLPPNVFTRKNVDRNWKREDFLTVEQIKITGGEPLLHPDFIKFLDMLISTERTDSISLLIFTNASFVPKKHLIDRLSKFKNIKLYLSIDGVGKVHEYIRHNSVWETTEKAYVKWLETELEHHNINVCFSPTISLFNIMYVEQLISWWMKKRIEVHGNKKHNFSTAWNVMNSPRCMTIHDFHKADERISDLLEYKNSNDFPSSIDTLLSTIIENLQSINSIDDEKRKEFVQYTKDLDKLRNQNIKESLPKLYELYEDLFEQYDGRLDK